MADRTKNSIQKYGAIICSTKWDNINNHPLLNIMLVCPNEDLFLEAIDTTMDQKDAQYICNALAEYIQNVGVDNVVHICTDNASNMQSASDMLRVRYPTIYFQGCVAHYFDLLLGDWGKEPWVKPLVSYVKKKFVHLNAPHAFCNLQLV